MTEELITDKKLFEALEWLQKNGRKAAEAKGYRVYIEKYVGHVRAKIAQECIDKGESAAKADIKAEASDAYHDVLKALDKATENDTYYTWHRTRFEGLIAAWQTLSANRRAIDKAL